MAVHKTYTVTHRRKREGKTDYKRRLGLLKSGKMRLVVRSSQKNTLAQIVEYQPAGDKVLLSANSRELVKMGWNVARSNLCTAYLVGLLIARKAKKSGVSEAILDLGLVPATPGSRPFAVVRGARDGGLGVPCGEEILPPEDRVSGKHVQAYAQSLKSDKSRYQRQFSAYMKAGISPEELPKLVETLKKKIAGA